MHLRGKNTLWGWQIKLISEYHNIRFSNGFGIQALGIQAPTVCKSHAILLLIQIKKLKFPNKLNYLSATPCLICVQNHFSFFPSQPQQQVLVMFFADFFTSFCCNSSITNNFFGMAAMPLPLLFGVCINDYRRHGNGRRTVYIC